MADTGTERSGSWKGARSLPCLAHERPEDGKRQTRIGQQAKDSIQSGSSSYTY